MPIDFDRWLEDLNQRIEDAKHGRHWRASKTSKGSAANQSNSRTGGAEKRAACYKALSTLHSSKDPGKDTSLASAFVGLMGLYWGPRSGKWAPPWMPGELGVPNSASPGCRPHAIPQLRSEGMVAGEIIAWRAWYWDEERQRLRSIFVDYEWPLTAPATGEPAIGYGLHAFKTRQRAFKEYERCQEDVIFGQVALWGDVVEYQHGYCAEFGRVHSLIDHERPHIDVPFIRETYKARTIR